MLQMVHYQVRNGSQIKMGWAVFAYKIPDDSKMQRIFIYISRQDSFKIFNGTANESTQEVRQNLKHSIVMLLLCTQDEHTDQEALGIPGHAPSFLIPELVPLGSLYAKPAENTHSCTRQASPAAH